MATTSHIETSRLESVLAENSGGSKSPNPSLRASWRAHLAEMFQTTVNQMVPLGYEDECGFHLGQPESES